MPRYVGLYCLKPKCRAFIIWKEIPPGDPPLKVKALDIVTGTCPKCRSSYSVLAEQMVEVENNSEPRRSEKP